MWFARSPVSQVWGLVLSIWLRLPDWEEAKQSQQRIGITLNTDCMPGINISSQIQTPSLHFAHFLCVICLRCQSHHLGSRVFTALHCSRVSWEGEGHLSPVPALDCSFPTCKADWLGNREGTKVFGNATTSPLFSLIPRPTYLGVQGFPDLHPTERSHPQKCELCGWRFF